MTIAQPWDNIGRAGVEIRRALARLIRQTGANRSGVGNYDRRSRNGSRREEVMCLPRYSGRTRPATVDRAITLDAADTTRRKLVGAMSGA